MSVTPVNGSTQVYTPQPAANPAPPASSNKNSSAIPEDTVTISPAAKAQQTGASGDVDHDHDSK